MTQATNLQLLPLTSGLAMLGKLPLARHDLLLFFEGLRAQYGDIYRLNLGFGQPIMLNHPRHAQHVFIDHSRTYVKTGVFWNSIRTLIGNGLIVSEGDFWLRQRRMMQPHFHMKRLAKLTAVMVAAIAESFDAWEQRVNCTFDVSPAWNAITMNVMTKAMFGASLDQATMHNITHAMSFAIEYLMVGMVAQVLPPAVPMPNKTRFQHSIQVVDDVLLSMIEARRQSDTPHDDLLSMLIETVDTESGESMTNSQLRDEVFTLFLAGYETTATAMTWLSHFMLYDVSMVRQLRDEVDRVLQGRLPTFDDLPHLTYTRMVFQEALRIMPPAWWVTRQAVEDDEIDGFLIPAGSTVTMMMGNIQRHPDFWQMPDQFIPERFTPDAIAARHKYAWIPFGAGKRMCIGRDFALIEAQCILAIFMQRYEFAPVEGHFARPQMSTSRHPKAGVLVHLERRKD